MGNREQRDRWRQEAEPGPQAEEFFINGPNFFWNDPRPQGNIAALNLPQEVANASVRRSFRGVLRFQGSRALAQCPAHLDDPM
jgi:hypothetical protein